VTLIPEDFQLKNHMPESHLIRRDCADIEGGDTLPPQTALPSIGRFVVVLMITEICAPMQ
jgi:hypothetical protein